MKHTYKCVFVELLLLGSNKKYTNSNAVNISELILSKYVKRKEKTWYFGQYNWFYFKIPERGHLGGLISYTSDS